LKSALFHSTLNLSSIFPWFQSLLSNATCTATLGWVVVDMRAMKQAALLYAPDGRAGTFHTTFFCSQNTNQFM
jgi:hypothetical protein